MVLAAATFSSFADFVIKNHKEIVGLLELMEYVKDTLPSEVSERTADVLLRSVHQIPQCSRVERDKDNLSWYWTLSDAEPSAVEFYFGFYLKSVTWDTLMKSERGRGVGPCVYAYADLERLSVRKAKLFRDPLKRSLSAAKDRLGKLKIELDPRIDDDENYLAAIFLRDLMTLERISSWSEVEAALDRRVRRFVRTIGECLNKPTSRRSTKTPARSGRVNARA